MIVFNEHNEFYNHVIHNFMLEEGLDNEKIIEIFLKEFTYQYLVNEQFKKCINTVKEIFYWTSDKKEHLMTAFHEVILYEVLEYMTYLQEELEDFNIIYFDETSINMINSLAKKDKKEMPEFSLKELKEKYFDIRSYEDDIFTDMDFLDLVGFYNNKNLGEDFLINHLGVNIDYYYEILPKDIREKYKTCHITLVDEISSLIDFLKEEIEKRDLYNLFWNKKKPLELNQIKIILNNIIIFYFKNQEIDIIWDIIDKDDSFQIIFSKKRDDEKIMVELIDPKKRNLEETEVDNMFEEAHKYNNAFFIFLVSDINEKKIVSEFISNYIYTDTIRAYLNVYIFDYHKRKAVSKK